MKIICNDKQNVIRIENIDNFNLEQTLLCGQCFRWKKISDNTFRGVVANKLIDTEQISDNIIEIRNVDKKFFDDVLFHYFDLGTDYQSIMDKLVAKDDVVKSSIEFGNGIRILRQDYFEIMMSFIISANNNIPRISKSVDMISEKFGTWIANVDGEDYYAFPTPEQLAHVTSEEFRKTSVGYRDKYLCDAVNAVRTGRIDLQGINGLPYEDIKNELLKVKGIGSKVADCVILYGYGYKSAFPVDTWMKKIINKYYCEDMTTPKQMLEFALEYFGEYAGVAQQYLFYYERESKDL